MVEESQQVTISFECPNCGKEVKMLETLQHNLTHYYRNHGPTVSGEPKHECPVYFGSHARSIRRIYGFIQYEIPNMFTTIPAEVTDPEILEGKPIVLAIEPVRDKRMWESDELETESRGDTVKRLIEQASQHVDIHKLFMDAGFDSKQVRDEVHQQGIQYILKTRRSSGADQDNIQDVLKDEVLELRVEHGGLNYEGREHDISWIYVKKEGDRGPYVQLTTTNTHVSLERAHGLALQYDQRMEIETTYQTIKGDFLPTTATKDYRLRLMFFVIGAMLYNIWRLANFAIRDEVDADLGDSPPIRAREIVEIVCSFLFDPGG